MMVSLAIGHASHVSRIQTRAGRQAAVKDDDRLQRKRRVGLTSYDPPDRNVLQAPIPRAWLGVKIMRIWPYVKFCQTKLRN